MWTEYIIPSSLHETLEILNQKRETSRLVAGATDLMLEFERGLRKGVKTLIDISHLNNLNHITLDTSGFIHLGPLITHNAVVSSDLLRKYAHPLVSASWQVGSPQIRNRATVAGNLVTASPANDTIAPLMALNAWLVLASADGNRKVPLDEFYTGVRKTVLHSNEMLIDIYFPAMQETKIGTFHKLGLRRAQAISVVNAAVVLEMNENKVNSAVITLGSVAPTIIHAKEAEEYLLGKGLSDEVIERAGILAGDSSRPIDDIRGTAAYRKAMVKVLVTRGLQQIHSGEWKKQVPNNPSLLQTSCQSPPFSFQTRHFSPTTTNDIHLKINNQEITLKSGYDKSLLRLLREDLELTGTKEGCAEGECGACTVFLNGKAVMACLVPAPCAEGSEIFTIEGLSTPTQGLHPSMADLNPVQRAFIQVGAVQCGYCTPGFIMSATKLLDERPHPSREEIVQALTGNLCRCTGYYKIIQAVELAVTLNSSY